MLRYPQPELEIGRNLVALIKIAECVMDGFTPTPAVDR